MSCGCNSRGSAPAIVQLSLDSLASLKSQAAESAPEGYTTQRLWMIGSRPVLATGTADGKKGCVTIPQLGVPIKLCWEIKDADLIPPEVSVRIRVTISVANTEYFSALLVFKCDNLLNPSSCTVSIEGEHSLLEAFGPSCDWSCLRDCAPGCLSCGTNYWCWAGCAGACIFRCCSL
ncbi:hypothetical protein K2D_00330 [Planctomycetes bacterium K2D]|uniref:Uncharacterized protein n=1 Tax=Botrimarina mediterranea TaxID=2528022 RepID=A0A518K274_9BACT|nr:hypothetical protein Spa11_00830 [Botrimarina mediterranea]QDV76455.1 hypothetical protein K2D_00330 [Planctomycetes bacterium K2D]